MDNPNDRPDDAGSSRARTPVSGEERERIVDLIRSGMSRNGVARVVGRSPSTVSLIAEAEGLSFDRSTVEAATKARQADNREARALLQELLLDDAMRLRTQLWEPAWLYNFNKDGEFSQERIERPDFTGQAAIMRTVGVAIDKSLRLAEVDSGMQNTDAARSVIGALGEALRVAAGEYKDPDDETDETEPE